MERKKSVDEITDDALKEGGILALLYFDIHGTTKNAVRDIMVGFVGKLAKERGVLYAYGEIDEPIESEGLFSTSAEVKLLAQDFVTLTDICARYSPVGIEILRPYESLKLSLGQAQSALLNIATITQGFTQLYMEKMMGPEEKAEYAKKIANRIEIGRKLLEKKGEKK